MNLKINFNLREFLIRLDLRTRTLILVVLDLFFLESSIIISFWITNIKGLLDFDLFILLSSIIFPLSLIIYFVFGQYRGLTRYVGSKEFYRLILRNFLISSLLIVCFSLLKIDGINIKFWILFWLFSSFQMAASRLFMRDMIFRKIFSKKIKNILIYGAGQAGAQLAASLYIRGGYKIINFVDDNPQLWGRNLNNIKILKPKEIYKIVSSVDEILLAIPSLSLKKRKVILEKLSNFSKPVLQIPSLEDISSGFQKISELRPITFDDLLCRDVVPPDRGLLCKSIDNLNVCITGAGGSIGSELCKQIVQFKPKSMILFERSEVALYQINKQLENLNSDINLYPILGSANDFNLVKKVFEDRKVEVVFHAAAYKHVPLVEKNPIQGIYNNVISTNIICRVSKLLKVKKFILISTDKAIRPTNVMGASKRVAENIVRGYSINNFHTKFAIVRFGNVLGSSGSVVPLFEKQISRGGPITLTHPDIIRYFMTITEASQLVLQAASLSKGGDVFLLDMGLPVKIRTLAEQMIKLSGLTIKNENNPNGDIEIINTGLRPGEKLFEELLIEDNSEITKHPLIFRAKEPNIDNQDLFDRVEKLENYLKNQNSNKSLQVLQELVPEWKPSFKFD